MVDGLGPIGLFTDDGNPPSMSFVILGAGLMGGALIHDLVTSGRSNVTVVDMDAARLAPFAGRYGAGKVRTEVLDVNDREATGALLEGHDVLINATTYRLNVMLTRLAIENNCHMLDLGGNMTVVEEQLAMGPDAERAGVTILPNCGLAPGMANVLAAWMLEEFDEPISLRIYVGGLPREPVPPLNYMQLFSVEGLINEYAEPCDAIEDGKAVKVEPLTGLEPVQFPEPFETLEAFNTSGGISTMVKAYEGRLRTMYYKTIRYPGHCAIFKAIRDMGLMSNGPVELEDVIVSPRAVLEDALARALPREGPDVTFMKLIATGMKEGKERRKTLDMMDEADAASGMSSMMRTTAFPTSIMAQMVADSEVGRRGVHTPETVVSGVALLREMRKRGIKCHV